MSKSSESRFFALLLITVALLISCVNNEPPVADAGRDQWVDGFSMVELDGVESRDGNGDVLRYIWTTVRQPPGSALALNSPNAANPNFEPEAAGEYEFQLVVDDGVTRSKADNVVVNVSGLKPDAGHSQTVRLGDSVKLNAEHSRSLTGGAFSYDWSFVLRPKNSVAELVEPESVSSHFVADVPGKYTVQLVLRADKLKSNSALVVVRTSVISADAGTNQNVIVGARIELDGSRSRSDNGAITYLWTVLSRPAGSKAVVAEPSLAKTEFTVDKAGDYALRLVVKSGSESASADIKVVATPSGPALVHTGGHFDQQHCVMCHDGVKAVGKPKRHVPASDGCAACHSDTYWAPVVKVDHSVVMGACVGCHDGVSATGKAATHIPTSNNCGACHSVVAFVPVVVVDKGETIGSCVDCHNGVIASGKSRRHIPSTDECEACHATITWAGVILVNHELVIGKCADCHNGVIAAGKPRTHILTTDKCEGCHKTTTFQPGFVDHLEAIGSCASCHRSPPNHLAVGVKSACEGCHTQSSWLNPSKPLPVPTGLAAGAPATNSSGLALGTGAAPPRK